jgi:hypothetical protein
MERVILPPDVNSPPSGCGRDGRLTHISTPSKFGAQRNWING